MRLYEFTNEPIITMNYLDYNHGQHDAEIIATQHNTEIGRIDFSIYKDVPSIHYIDTTVKRTGLATKMLKFLQSKFPEEEIIFGMTTDSGSSLYHSLEFKEIKNNTYDFTEEDDLNKSKQDILNQLSKYHINPDNPSYDHLSVKDEHIVYQLLNQYSDIEYDLEKEMDYQKSNNIKRIKKIII
jgi:hypothetical protein